MKCRHRMKHLHPPEPNLFCLAAMAYAAQQLNTIRTDAKAPEERPPNQSEATPPELAIPQEIPKWNEWLRLARQGNETAKLSFCSQAEPFINQFCNVTKFTDLLGKDEVRGIASLAVVEFLMEYPSPPEDKDIPFMLKRIIRNKITDQLRKMFVREQHNYKAAPKADEDDPEQKQDSMANLPASKKTEPETKLLQKEITHTALAAFRQLKPNEQTVLHAFFYQNKTPAAVAKALHCSRQYVEKVRDTALCRMHQLMNMEPVAASVCCPAT